jgi:hypothetical protein
LWDALSVDVHGRAHPKQLNGNFVTVVLVLGWVGGNDNSKQWSNLP